MSAIDRNQFKSVHYTAKTYDVVETTLRRRRAGIPSRCDCIPNMKKLTELEEKVIIQHSFELDSRGFSSQLGVIRDMANRLLAVCAGRQVGIRWPSNFVNRSPELKTRFNHKYDYQRALNKDPKVIQQWFECIQAIISKYGIQESDIFNFDETGFMMGIASTAKVVTVSEKGYKPKTV